MKIASDTSSPKIYSEHNWEDCFLHPDFKNDFCKNILPLYLHTMRWFGGKAKSIESVHLLNIIRFPVNENIAWLMNLQVNYISSSSELYALGIAIEKAVRNLAKNYTPAIICEATFKNNTGFLVDCIYLPHVRNKFLENMYRQAEIEFNKSILHFTGGVILKEKDFKTIPASKVLKAEQSNSSVIYGKKYFLKLYRKVDYQINPDVEVSKFLTEKTSFKNIPLYAGSVEITNAENKTITAAMLLQLIKNKGDLWKYTEQHLANYFAATPPTQKYILKSYTAVIKKLAVTTASLHKALAGGEPHSPFAAENTDSLYWENFSQAAVQLLKSKINLLHSLLNILHPSITYLAKKIIASEQKLINYFMQLNAKHIPFKKIRIHGDYHLGQILFTGKQLYILDFEGEPDKPHGERRSKHSPLKDIAGMLRSFHYAVYAYLQTHTEHENTVEAANAWYAHITSAYLHTYIEEMHASGLLPANKNALQLVLSVYIMEKAIYELGYELNNRPGWVVIPLKGIENILAAK